MGGVTQVIAGHGPRNVKLWKADHGLTSKSFCDAVVPLMRRLPVSRRCIMMDSHPSHTSSHTRSVFAKSKMKVIHLPKQAPDLIAHLIHGSFWAIENQCALFWNTEKPPCLYLNQIGAPSLMVSWFAKLS